MLAYAWLVSVTTSHPQIYADEHGFGRPSDLLGAGLPEAGRPAEERLEANR